MSTTVPNWAGQSAVDPLEEEENEVEIMVSGADSHLADDSAKDTSDDLPKTPKKFYYKAPEFEFAEGVTSLDASQIILSSCPASSAFLFNSVAGTLKSSGSSKGLSLIARVAYTPRGYTKCSYDIYGLVEGSTSALISPEDPTDLVSPFPAAAPAVPADAYPLLIGVTHVTITTQFASPLAVALLTRISGPVSVLASLPHTAYTHTPIVTFSKPLDAPTNAKNPCLGPNPYSALAPPMLFALGSVPAAVPAPLLPPPNMLFGLDAALLTHARVHRRVLTAWVSVDHAHHFPGEALQAWEGALDALTASSIGDNAPALRAKAVPRSALARARVYAAWRAAWRRAPVSLQHRDLAAHKLAMMTDKSIPHGIFA